MSDDHGTELAFLQRDLTKVLAEVRKLRDQARRVTTAESTVYHGLAVAETQLDDALAGLEEWL